MNVKKVITVLVGLIALILIGTVVVLSTVVQYFGVDKRDVIQDYEMLMAERLVNATHEVPVEDVPPWQEPPVGDRTDVGEDSQRAAAFQPVGGDITVTEGDDLNDGSVNEFLDRLQERGWIAETPAAAEGAVAANGAVEQPYDDMKMQQRIPKIIHATWKTDIVPEREFKLWSDAASRVFIAEHYPWFLPTFDGYTYPIQRADVIRYFVLHHYGGIYMDLDIGCRRNLDPLLYFRVILPQTIPVGVSNDLMFAEKGHPFMDLVIHNLMTFDHTYGTNYPTVMFSTGPMFLSAVYGMWPKDTPDGVERHVRILPRRWYGKNAGVTELPDSFFSHYYGSSWHAEDAGFITFLGKFGIALMYAGVAVVVLGAVRIFWSKRTPFKTSPRQLGPIALPHEALPFTRSGTPTGSRPGTPGGSRSATPAPRADGKPGGLFYLPVWLYPGDRTPGGRSPGDSQGAWTQYFSNLSFVDDGNGGHRYEPLPNFSRPPSPSNNSILHAPGATHDGAFDGVHLHSLRQGPAPPGYTAVVDGDGNVDHHATEAVVDARGRSAGARGAGVRGGSSGRTSDDGASAAAAASPSGDGSVERATADGARDGAGRRRAGGESGDGGFTGSELGDEVDAILAGSGGSGGDDVDGRGGEHQLASAGGRASRQMSYDSTTGVEAQVDRLLSEMAPDAVSSSSPASPRLE
ncbi:hypothetical protein JCM8202v2_000205 [Rhodotorula sphaerocarpa]